MKMMNKQLLGHILACGTQIMWGATFVSTKVLLNYFQPVEILFIRMLLAVIALFVIDPHPLRLGDRRRELAFAGAGLTGLVLYFLLENTALTMTYASNVGIIVACAPFFVAVMVGIFFKEKQGKNFYIGFVIAIAGVIMVSVSGKQSFHLNPFGDFLAFLAMISWGAYSAIVKKISEWDYPIVAVTRRIYFYGVILLLPVLLYEEDGWNLSAFREPTVIANLLFLGLCASALGFFLWNLATGWIGAVKTSLYIYVSPIVTVVLSMFVLHEKMTVFSVIGSVCILIGLMISQGKLTEQKVQVA